ncbi:MAG TPA: hypothetical protein VFQ85_11805 [Mycobacteriales bacterium]|nr:hypothetical protein [Mycobacteriales bacterium]
MRSRRLLALLVLVSVMLAGFFLIALLGGGKSVAAAAVEAVLLCAGSAGGAALGRGIVLRRNRRQRSAGGPYDCSFRRHGDRRPGRWRQGRLQPGPPVVVTRRFGEGRVVIEPAAVRAVSVRGVTGREVLWVNASCRVVEVTFDGGRADVAVLPPEEPVLLAALGRQP